MPCDHFLAMNVVRHVASGVLPVALALMTSAGTTSAQARPQTLAPQPNAGMDASPAQIIVNYDDPIDPSGSSLAILDATDNAAQGFYTFVIGGGLVGIINGVAQSQAPAAELTAALTVTAAEDGSSPLRVDLSNTSGVERVRIRLRGQTLSAARTSSTTPRHRSISRSIRRQARRRPRRAKPAAGGSASPSGW